ncbi:MAG TPA: 3-dehydroquinate synthase [Ktedonobacterales bacterium]
METPLAADAVRILILGPTGAGKSTTGKLLAHLLGWRFVDLDEVIVAHDGRPVSAIFAEDGEDGWRSRESATLAAVLREERVVIAGGAGLVEREENRRLARDAGAWTVALDIPPEVALRRIAQQSAEQVAPVGELRPMLAGEDPLASMRAMRERRAPLYALADDHISTDSLDPTQVAGRALAGISLAGRLPKDGAETQTSVVTAGAGYNAVAGWGALAHLPRYLATLRLPPRVTVVSDSAVSPIYAEPLARVLRDGGYDPAAFAIPAGEANKSRASLEAVYDFLAERRAERGEALLALGGGVVGDLAGFAAATWLRGVPLVQLPTSLLAQVDASIGGKVAIDHPRGKNLIGAFYQPRLVVADTSTLLTLPGRACTEGWAEVIKHGAALDSGYFTAIERDANALLAAHPAELTAAVARSVAIKGAVVAGDERESEDGQRALLNYGHTLGHAIETVTGYTAWLHGEAVSAGMVFAAQLGVRLGVTPPEVAARVEALLSAFGLPTRLDGLDGSALLRATHWDKKARDGQVRWVLLTGLGASVAYGPAPEAALRSTLAELGATIDTPDVNGAPTSVL